jgi:hypothetical protein
LLDIHVYWNIVTMHGPINVKSPNNTSKWQMGFNSAFKGLIILNTFSHDSAKFVTTDFVAACKNRSYFDKIFLIKHTNCDN